jgi:CheY-like chemotaxis protein
VTGQVDVLLVEDNAGDVRLIQEGMKVIHSRCRLSVVGDGEEALEFLRQRGKYAGAARPALMLLDLNLPKKDGMEVLMEVKNDPFLKRMPVMILTSSGADRDVNMAYELGANSYLRKAESLDGIYDMMRSIEYYWMNLSALPTI